MFEVGKEYKTRDGRKVRIYATDGVEGEEIHGATYEGGVGWYPQTWGAGGRYRERGNSASDIMPPEPESDYIDYLLDRSATRLTYRDPYHGVCPIYHAPVERNFIGFVYRMRRFSREREILAVTPRLYTDCRNTICFWKGVGDYQLHTPIAVRFKK